MDWKPSPDSSSHRDLRDAILLTDLSRQVSESRLLSSIDLAKPELERGRSVVPSNPPVISHLFFPLVPAASQAATRPGLAKYSPQAKSSLHLFCKGNFAGTAPRWLRLSRLLPTQQQKMRSNTAQALKYQKLVLRKIYSRPRAPAMGRGNAYLVTTLPWVPLLLTLGVSLSKSQGHPLTDVCC